MSSTFWWGLGLMSPAIILVLCAAADWAWHNPKDLVEGLLMTAFVAGCIAAVVGLVLLVVGLVESNTVCTPDLIAKHEYCKQVN